MEFSFQIGDQNYEVPAIIDIAAFERAMAWDITDIQNHKPFVASITACPIHVLNRLDNITFEVVLAICMSRLPIEEGEVNFTLGVYPIKKFEDFTFGDFIDLDILIADGLTKHVIEIVSKLYGMPEEHAATIDINKVWSTLIALTKWREAQYREYDEFFNLSQSVEQDGPEMTINNLQLMWYEAVLVLADSHFLNIQHVVERPYKEALNYLTWKKNQVAQQQLANVKKKYDLQKRT
jgi:hypothetical protein